MSMEISHNALYTIPKLTEIDLSMHNVSGEGGVLPAQNTEP